MYIDEVNDFFGDLDLYLLDWILKGKVQNRGRILDAGAGTGRNLTYFLNDKWKVNAIDKSSSDIDLLNFTTNQLGYGDIGETGDLHELRFEDDYFDFIICSRVLHFAASELSFFKMLDELYRVLKKRGQLYLSMASEMSSSIATSQSPVGKTCFPGGKGRFVLNQHLLSEIDKKWQQETDPRTVIIGKESEETTLIMRPI